MKKFLVILILVPLLSFSKSTLILDIHSCKTNSLGPTRMLKVVKDGNLIYPLFDSSFFSGTIWINDLDTGLYHIQYQNIFQIDVYDSIRISNFSVYTMNVCVDKFNKHDKAFHGLVDSVSELSPLIIKTNSVHTNSVQSELRIVKKGNKIYAYLRQKFYIKGEKRPNINKSVVLPQTMIDRIRQFEYELGIIANDNTICSGRTYYSIQLGLVKKKYLDPTCKWDGVYDLIKEIFK